jgi:F-type H+-transporting ATPase subunit epsilon
MTMAAAPHAGPESEVLDRHAPTHGTAVRLSFTVVTPAGQAASGTVDEVTAPGLIGEFGVLPGHVPLLAALKAGVLSWRDGQGRHSLAVDKGYLQVGAANRVIVLVEKALRPEAIDVPEAREEAAKHAEALKQGNLDPAQLELTRSALEWAQARIDAGDRSLAKTEGKH